MEGPTLRDEDMQGVIPRMVDKLFTAIADQDEDIAFTLSVSYFEVSVMHERRSMTVLANNPNLCREMSNRCTASV